MQVDTNKSSNVSSIFAFKRESGFAIGIASETNYDALFALIFKLSKKKRKKRNLRANSLCVCVRLCAIKRRCVLHANTNCL